MTDKLPEKLEELISGFDTAMLVTQSLDNGLRARPMAIAGRGEAGVLFFTTRSEDAKLEEILRSSAVAVTMQDTDCYLSISGRARLETDILLAEDMWTPAMRAWFPEGYTDSQFTVIRVVPTYAEYWDRSGLRKLELIWETGKAILKGEKADDQGLSGHQKIRFVKDESEEADDRA